MGYNTRYDTEYGSSYFPSYKPASYDTETPFTTYHSIETTTIHTEIFIDNTTKKTEPEMKPWEGAIVIFIVGILPWLLLLYALS